MRILGIPVTDPVEIVEFDPPDRYAIRHQGLFEGDGAVHPRARGGRHDDDRPLDGDGSSRRCSPTSGPSSQAPILRAIFQADLERMKRLVETGAAAG